MSCASRARVRGSCLTPDLESIAGPACYHGGAFFGRDLLGLNLIHRTSKGYRFETGYSPRYILGSPTLDGQRASGTGQFGAFVVREWRF